jgi:hypothetical protein
MLHSLDTLIGFAVVMSVVSLLIMLITQAVSAAFGLRGKNLSDALEAMLHKIDPAINDQSKDVAKRLADAVLTTPVISDSTLSMCKRWPVTWKRASAIRPDELLQVLGDIASGKASPTSGEKQAKTVAASDPVRKAANGILQKLGATSDVSAAALKAAGPALVDLEAWFNSAQDRAQQWFAMHTRMVTIFAAFVMAFVLQLDAIQLLRRISADPDVRTKLVADAEAVQKESAKILQNADAPDVATNKEIVAELKKEKHPEIGTKLDQSPTYGTLADVDNWIRGQLASTPNLDKIVTDYNQLFFQKRLASSSKDLAEVRRGLENTGLQLLPSPYPKIFNDKPHRKYWQIFSGEWSWPKQHLLGILVAAALLGLGAPFWFNTLKSLTNLRPLLAREVEKDPKQIPQKPAK